MNLIETIKSSFEELTREEIKFLKLKTEENEVRLYNIFLE
jgi:hypothetical protein